MDASLPPIRSGQLDLSTLRNAGGAADTPRPSLPPRVFVVSEVRLLRDGLTLALSRRPDMQVVGEADLTVEGAARVLESDPDVVLLDLGGSSWLPFARHLSERLPKARLVAFAVSEVERNIDEYAEAGFCGFVPRDGSVDEVANAVASAMRGELACSPRIAASMLRRLKSLSGVTRVGPVGSLTRREAEIVRLVDEGLSNKEIGGRLQIGTATVKNHMHHILEKLHVRRRSQAAARLRSTRLV